MLWTNQWSDRDRSRPWLGYLDREEVDSIRGTIQRVDYRRRELRVIAQCRSWRFVVADHCLLSFNGTPAMLRCFHPLDRVTVLFRGEGTEQIAVAIFFTEGE